MTDRDEYEKARFRITVWPPRIELPPVEVGQYSLDPTEGALLFEPPRKLYRSPGDTYLQLYALDLDRPTAILVFAKQYGHLGGHDLLASFEEQLRVLRSYPDETLQDRQREDAIRAARDTQDFEVLEDFRFAARLLRDLTSAWRVASGQASPDEIAWHFTFAPSHGEARALLRAYISPLLRALHPRLEVIDLLNDDTRASLPAVAHTPASAPATLYELCAAELFNHIAGQTQYKTCANETCQQLFVLQRGRAIHGQHHTTGVKYCSNDCARAQNQRAYRRRLARATKPPR